MGWSNIFGGGHIDVVLTTAVVVVGAGLWLWWTRQKQQQKPDPSLRVGTVSNVFVYPIKSVRGLPVEKAVCTPVGLELPGTNIRDRHLLITTSDYNFITQRQKPSLALVRLSIHGNEIHVDAPKMTTLIVNRTVTKPTCTVRIFGNRISAADCGAEASDWLSTYLQQEGVRMCMSVSGPVKRILREVKEEPFKIYMQKAKKDDQVIFADVAPYMVLSEGSLEDLNSRMDDKMTMYTFRPNITISGCPPFDEDTWKEMKIGDARFSFIVRCDRCILTTVNPETGTKRSDGEPLKTLRNYRLLDPAFKQSPFFGTMWVLDHPGTIRVGDPVYVTKA